MLAAFASRAQQLLGATTSIGADSAVVLNGVTGGVSAVRDDDADDFAVELGLYAPGHVCEVRSDLVGGHKARDAVALGVVKPGALGGRV